MNLNPIELLRSKLDINQRDFAEDLGYNNVHNYRYHCTRFSSDILDRIDATYEIDLRDEVIKHLRLKVKNRPQQQPALEKSKPPKKTFEDMVG